jgi:hypothetical protein
MKLCIRGLVGSIGAAVQIRYFRFKFTSGLGVHATSGVNVIKLFSSAISFRSNKVECLATANLFILTI